MGQAAGLARNRDFLLLWFGQAVSQVGDRVQQIALVWWALQRGGSLGAVSWALVATTLPVVLVSLFAGVVVDRYDRRIIMVTCDLSRAVLVTGIVWLSWTDRLTLPLLLVATGLIAFFGAFFGPAAMACIPDLVREEDMLRANSLQEMTFQGAMVAGPALGGALVAWLGAGAAFAANGLSFLFCGLSLLAMRLPARPSAAADESPWRQLLGGLAVLRDDRGVAVLLGLFALANFFLAPVTVLLPYYAQDVFRVGAGGLGVLEGTIGAGMMAGALALAGKGAVRRRRAAVQLGLIVPGLCLAGMGAWASFYWFLAALLLLGAAISVLNIVAITHFQQVVPAEKLGRFMGLLMTVIMALVPLSYATAGLASLGVPAGTILLAGGLVVLLLGLAVPLLPLSFPSPPREG